MTLLMDTHVFLWWVTDQPGVSQIAHDAITNPGNRLLLSAASGWEIAIGQVPVGLRLVTHNKRRWDADDPDQNAGDECLRSVPPVRTPQVNEESHTAGHSYQTVVKHPCTIQSISKEKCNSRAST